MGTVIDGEVVSELRGGVKRDYVPDPLGSMVALLDNTQTQTDTCDYWLYGESAARTGTTTTPFQYVGTMGYHKYGSSKSYVRAPYFDKYKGRWITESLIGINGGIKFYDYANSKFVSLIDPDGLKACPKYPPFQCFYCRYARLFHLGKINLTDVCNAAKDSCGGWNPNLPDWDDISAPPDNSCHIAGNYIMPPGDDYPMNPVRPDRPQPNNPFAPGNFDTSSPALGTWFECPKPTWYEKWLKGMSTGIWCHKYENACVAYCLHSWNCLNTCILRRTNCDLHSGQFIF